MHLAVDRVQAYYFSTRTKFTKRSKVVTRFLIKFCRLTLRKGLEMKMWAIPSSSFCFCSSFLPLNSCFCLLFTCVVCRETVIWQSRWTTQKPDQNDPNHLRLRNKKIEKKRRWNGNKTKNLLLEFRPPRAGPECFLYLFLFSNFPFHSSYLRSISIYALKRGGKWKVESIGSRGGPDGPFLTLGRTDIRHVYILNLERGRYRSGPNGITRSKKQIIQKAFPQLVKRAWRRFNSFITQ